MTTKNYWWEHAHIYKLYIDKFAGDIQGLTARLDYVALLGIDCLHVLPHYPSPMVDDGYDVSDYRNVRDELGMLDDFAALVATAHGRGIRIIIDFVLNHVSDKHSWFAEARMSRENSKRDFFLWSNTGKEYSDATNAFPDIKPVNWIRNEATRDYYYATFYPEQPDLNWDNPEVMREMTEIMDFWCSRGVDGFRLDAAPYLIKREGTTSKGLPETHQVLKKIRVHLEKNYPDVVLLAETHQSVKLMRQYFGNGDECHLVYHFGLMEQMWLALKRNDPRLVEKIAHESFDIPDNCQWATFLRNHDEISLGTLDGAERKELMDFFDPEHDYMFKKMGATSMRLANVFRGDRRKIVNALKLLYSLPGSPVMYYGDEIGMQNLPLQQGIVDTRRYVRGAFDWQEAERQIADSDSFFHEVAGIIASARQRL